MTVAAPAPALHRPDPNFREPFNADRIAAWLDVVPFSPPFLFIIPALLAVYSQKVHDVSLVPTSVDGLKHVWGIVTSEYKIPLFMVAFIAIKTLNRTLSRIVRNNGHYHGDKPDWSKEVVVVTGGSNGIGKEIAVLLAERSKHPVAVLDLAPMSYYHPNIKYYKTNVGSEAEFASVAAKIRADIGEPTVVINNAGIAIGRRIDNTPTEAMMRVLSVNTFAHMFSAQQFLPHMVKHNHGHIVTVASSASYLALPNMVTYSMSKAAALAFHETLQAELRARHKATKVRTTIVCPTKVSTLLGANLADHPNPFFTPTLLPETVARRIVSSIDKGLSEHHMMPNYTIMLPMLRGAPSWVKRLIEVAGHTDNSVTDASDDYARKIGYTYALPNGGESPAASTDTLVPSK